MMNENLTVGFARRLRAMHVVEEVEPCVFACRTKCVSPSMDDLSLFFGPGHVLHPSVILVASGEEQVIPCFCSWSANAVIIVPKHLLSHVLGVQARAGIHPHAD